MRHRILPVLAAATLTVSCWALALAREHTAKSAQNASAGTACTAAMASKCTPEQAAACKAKGASATTAAFESKGCAGMMGVVAMTSVNTRGASAAGQGCSAHGAAAMAAGSNCSAHGAAATASMVGCPHGASAGKTADGVTAGGPGCSGYKSMASPGDCDACTDMAACESELRSAMTQTQIVPLKNGVMFVYMSDTPTHVRTVQTAMGHRTDRLTAITAAGDRAHLCPECKNIRGAVASGKLSRETVNIEGGCLTLMTSSDPAMIAKLHTMAGLSAAGRKS